MVSQIVRYSTPRGSPAHSVTSPTSPLTTTMTPITPAGTGVSVSVPSTGAYSSSRFVEKTSVLDDMDDDRDDNDNNNRANILKTLTRGRNVIEVGPIKKYDDLENNAIRGSLTIRGIITSKTNEGVALSELVRTEPEKCPIKSIKIRTINDNNKKTSVNDNTTMTMTMTMTMTTDTNTNTSSHSSSRSVNSITDRRLEGSNHDEAGEHQRDDVVTDGREVNGSTTVSEKLEDEKKREYKTDKSQDVDEDEDEEEEEEEEDERDDGSLTKKENGIPERVEDLNNNGEQSLPTDDDESSSESVEDEDDRTVISVRHGSDSDRTARGSSLLSDRSNEEDLFDDNGWLVTDQDLEERKLPRTREHSLEGEDTKKIEHSTPKVENLEIGPKDVTTGGDLARSPESSLRSRVYRQSNLGKNGWLISDESESESERAVSPDDKKAETMETKNEDDENEENNTNKEDDKEPDNESKREPWSIEENGWMIVNEDETSVKNNEPTKESQTTDKTDLNRGRSSTIRSQTTTDLVSRANVENGALVANATRSKETERSDEHEAASDVNISIPMQMRV